MSDNRITMNFMDVKHTSVLRPDGWKVEPTGKWQWLQRKCWNFLNRCGAVKPYRESVYTSKRVDINADNIFEAVCNSKHRLLRDGHKPNHVFIGREDAAKMLSDPNYMNVGKLVTTNARAGYGHEIYNLPVTIVPHMNGVLVI